MTETVQKDKEPVYSPRRKRSLNRKRLMDLDITANSNHLPPGTEIAVYSRVSREEQALHGYSLPAQVRACKAFAAQRKWKIVKFYSDPGYSGKDDKRPGFTKMIADAENQQF